MDKHARLYVLQHFMEIQIQINVYYVIKNVINVLVLQINNVLNACLHTFCIKQLVIQPVKKDSIKIHKLQIVINVMINVLSAYINLHTVKLVNKDII